MCKKRPDQKYREKTSKEFENRAEPEFFIETDPAGKCIAKSEAGPLQRFVSLEACFHIYLFPSKKGNFQS
jgi:hypothetical protein